MPHSESADALLSVPLPHGATVTRTTPLFGSSTCTLYRLDASDGLAYFAKTCSASSPDVFEQESLGLHVLGEVGGLPVPPVVSRGTLATNLQYMIMPFITRFRSVGGGARRQEAEAGRCLARLHQHTSSDGRFGAMVPRALLDGEESRRSPADGRSVPHTHYDALLTWSSDWPTTYLETMLGAQVARARRRGLWSARRDRDFSTFCERFSLHFSSSSTFSSSQSDTDRGANKDEPGSLDVSQPAASLLHGDLWGGNLLFDQSGAPWFIDPMPLYGDRELDLAMTELFGGFGEEFYAAYEEVHPLRPGHAQRVPWYQLYYLLLHLNLFGEAYGSAVESAMRSI